MKLRLEDKKQAIELRLRGKSYREIMAVIPNLQKSTLSGWLRNVRLTSEQEARLKKNLQKIIHNARIRAAWAKKKKKQKRIKRFTKEAKKDYLSLSKNPLFLIGLVLYWAEGAKKHEVFQFTNSDPRAVKAMMRWLTEICEIPKEKIKIRVFIHKVYAHENCEKFWSKITGVPISKLQKTIYKPTLHKVKKNPQYKGCVQLRVYSVEFFWKIMGWIQKLAEEFCFK
jgi:hypothetical protein